MSKKLARSPQSYQNELIVTAMAPELLRAKGFERARIRREGGMKFVDASTSEGAAVSFWLKQGWTDNQRYSAIQFGMFTDLDDPASEPDATFVEYVAARVERAKARGATHALLVHMVNGSITNYVALTIDDVVKAYRRQIRSWPSRARNTKTPTLYFEDSRANPDAVCVDVVTELEVALEAIAGVSSDPPEVTPGRASRKVTPEGERRLQQQAFRVRVGERCGWRCVVTGVAIREVLEAAHLPGRDWRTANQASDGVLIRADLHRLLDRSLADVQDGKFLLAAELRNGDYSEFHGRLLQGADEDPGC